MKHYLGKFHGTMRCKPVRGYVVVSNCMGKYQRKIFLRKSWAYREANLLSHTNAPNDTYIQKVIYIIRQEPTKRDWRKRQKERETNKSGH